MYSKENIEIISKHFNDYFINMPLIYKKNQTKSKRNSRNQPFNYAK
jgi:hypothetical protein